MKKKAFGTYINGKFGSWLCNCARGLDRQETTRKPGGPERSNTRRLAPDAITICGYVYGYGFTLYQVSTRLIRKRMPSFGFAPRFPYLDRELEVSKCISPERVRRGAINV